MSVQHVSRISRSYFYESCQPCQSPGNRKVRKQVPLGWVISSLYHIPSCSREMLLRDDPGVTKEMCRKPTRVLNFILPLHYIFHAPKSDTYMILMLCLTTFLLRNGTLTIASWVPRVPHITVLISAKRGRTHFQNDRLTTWTNFTLQPGVKEFWEQFIYWWLGLVLHTGWTYSDRWFPFYKSWMVTSALKIYGTEII